MKQIRIYYHLTIFIIFFSAAFFFSSIQIVEASSDSTHLKDIRDINDPAIHPGPETHHENPHGSYMNNTNACKDCHAVHTGKTEKLLKETTQEETCFLCHDGRGSKYDAKNGKTYDENTETVSDSVAGGFNGFTSSHDVEMSNAPQGGKGLQMQLVCTSCHNPHGSENYRKLQTTVNGKTSVVVKASVSINPFSNKEIASYESGITTFCTSCHEDYMTYYQENPVNDSRYYRHPVETLLTGGKPRIINPSVPASLLFSPTLFTTLPTQGVPSGAYPNPASSVITGSSLTVTSSAGGSLPSGDYEYIVTKMKDGEESIIGAKLAAAVPENGKTTINWPPGTASDTFQIYRRKKLTDSRLTPVARIKTVTGVNSFTDNGNMITYQPPIKSENGTLPSGNYLYLIQGVTGGDTSYESELISVALNTTEKSVSFDWTAISGASKYYLFRADPDGSGGFLPFKMLAKIDAVDSEGVPIPNANHYNDSGYIRLKPLPEMMPTNLSGTVPVGTYYYMVTAKNALGESHQGYIKKVNTNSNGSTIVLEWDAITNATGYRVYRAQPVSGEPVLTDFKLVADSTDAKDSFTFKENDNEGYFYFSDTNLAVGTDSPKDINSQGANTSKVVCITCHYVHGTKKTDSYTGDSKLKRLDNSGVCQNCHKR
jgi:predicted CXXCH cytochrome family protein